MLANTKCTDDKLGNCICAMSYLEAKDTEAFRSVKDNTNQGSGINVRRISAVEFCGQGRGGRGWCRGWGGKGRGWGHGRSNGRYSMEWTTKNSNNASNQAICNIWVLKETPTSPKCSHNPTRKDMETITAPRGKRRKRQLVTTEMKEKRPIISPRNPSRRKEAWMETILDMLTIVRSYILLWKWAPQLGVLDSQKSLSVIKALLKKQFIMGKYDIKSKS